MKKFIKGTLETIVEDNDRRIPEYIANGWKEKKVEPKPQSESEKRAAEAISEASKPSKGNKKSGKHNDKKINEAIAATETAHTESEPVDDGLFAKGGE